MLISADWFTSWIHKRLIMRCVRSSLIFLRAFGHALLVPTTPAQPKFNCFTYTDTHAHQHVRATAFATSFFFFAKRRSCYTQCAQYIFFCQGITMHNNSTVLQCVYTWSSPRTYMLPYYCFICLNMCERSQKSENNTKGRTRPAPIKTITQTERKSM